MKNKTVIPSVRFRLPYDSRINLVILDSEQIEVLRVIDNRFFSTGVYSERINIKDYTAGDYYCKLETERDIIIKKLSVL